MTKAVSSRQPSGKPPRGRSDRSLFKARWSLSHSWVHSQRLHVNEVCPGVSNEAWLHRFSSPPFGSPFILFSFTHMCFHLFFHVLLSSCLVISSFLSFARTLVPALVCTRAPRFQVAQVFTMRWLFIVCPCALGSLSSQPHTLLPRPVPLSCLHSFVSAVSTHTSALALALFAFSRGGVCVCVCDPGNHRGPFGLCHCSCWFFLSAGGHRGRRGAVANEDLLWGPCKRTCQTG